MSEHDPGVLDALEPHPVQWGGHPLFPRPETETGPDTRRFDIIHVIRYKADQTKEVCPKAWRGSELRSWEQIVDAYGGGVYQLAAQCSRTYRYQGYTEKITLPGPPKGLGEMPKVVAVEPAPEPPLPPAPPAIPTAQTVSLPPAQPSPPQATNTGASTYAIPFYAPPPAANNNDQTIALVRTMIEASSQSQAAMAQQQTALLRAILERPAPTPPPAPPTPSPPTENTSPLQVIRELAPILQNGNAGTNALLQGIEVARDLYRSNGLSARAALPPPPQEDELALITSMFRMLVPATASTSAAAPNAPAPLPPAISAPPSAPPPGHAWVYTPAGWALVATTQISGFQSPEPIAPPTSKNAPAATSIEATIASVLADPAKRERVMRAAFESQPAATEKTSTTTTENAPEAPPGPAIAADITAAFEEAGLGRLFAAINERGNA